MEAEEIASRQFNGHRVTELNQQYKDIDLIVTGTDNQQYTVSIKDQLWSSGKFGGIQVETQLTNTTTGQSMDGCFLNNDSDFYFWRITYQNKDCWFIVKSSVLRRWVDHNKSSLHKWCTKHNTEEKNKQLGRKFNRAEGFTIRITEELIKLGKAVEVKDA